MTARERRVRQTEPTCADTRTPTYQRLDGSRFLHGDERTGTSERRVASYRWCIDTLLDHAVSYDEDLVRGEFNPRPDIEDIIAAVRRPKVTEEELAEAIESRQVLLRDVDGGIRIGKVTPADAAMLARVALEMGRKG